MHEDLRSLGPLALIVMGVSGSGKTTLGTALAAALDCPFLEGDDFHSPDAVERMRNGIPLTDADRRPWLERLGRALDAAVAQHRIAVASCSALKKIYRAQLRATLAAPTGFVFLDANAAELLQRMTHRAGHYMPPSLLSSQLAALERPAATETALTLDASAPTATACAEVLAWARTIVKAGD